ncbi:hypothetical protein CSKR_112407 [Clonorchis sinensis]|uniref:Uncharacterized protein n=1 Tax=Clonorchis sinensis TaxID=79923 RepID=A0A3R7F989_CLOSI|nr:hypothetical protein CSKR_112407 [Clonorchis sinensis]
MLLADLRRPEGKRTVRRARIMAGSTVDLQLVVVRLRDANLFAEISYLPETFHDQHIIGGVALRCLFGDKYGDPADGTTRRPTWHESIVSCKCHNCTWDGILSGRSHLDRRTIRVFDQSLWLKSLTSRQRCLAGNANVIPFLRNMSPHVPTPNLEDQETVFVRPLTIDQPGMRDSVSVAGTPPRIAQWVTEIHKPSHHGKVQSLRNGARQKRNIVCAPKFGGRVPRQHLYCRGCRGKRSYKH